MGLPYPLKSQGELPPVTEVDTSSSQLRHLPLSLSVDFLTTAHIGAITLTTGEGKEREGSMSLHPAPHASSQCWGGLKYPD